MDGNPYHPYDIESLSSEEDSTASVLSIEQLQRLLRILDASDVSELELRRSSEGIHLVLRKLMASINTDSSNVGTQQIASPQEASNVGTQFVASAIAGPQLEASEEIKHPVTASLVGIFHAWARPKGGALVAVGDHVKEGQLVATIESLNVLNEVEAPAAGHVTEILIQEGQPVEYGQVLMIIDSSSENR